MENVSEGDVIENRAFTMQADGKVRYANTNEEILGEGQGTYRGGNVTIKVKAPWQFINGGSTAIARGSKVIGYATTVDGSLVFGLVRAATLPTGTADDADWIQAVRGKGFVINSANTSSSTVLADADVDVM